jgi:hypothetical protein
MNTKTTGLAFMLPAALNPAVAAAIGIGLVGIGIYRLLGDDDENREPEELPKPSPSVASTVADSISDNSQSTPTVCLERKQQDGPQLADLHQQEVDRDDVKKKIIREAMSELGKRSAAARARKKADASASKTV